MRNFTSGADEPSVAETKREPTKGLPIMLENPFFQNDDRRSLKSTSTVEESKRETMVGPIPMRNLVEESARQTTRNLASINPRQSLAMLEKACEYISGIPYTRPAFASWTAERSLLRSMRCSTSLKLTAALDLLAFDTRTIQPKPMLPARRLDYDFMSRIVLGNSSRKCGEPLLPVKRFQPPKRRDSSLQLPCGRNLNSACDIIAYDAFNPNKT